MPSDTLEEKDQFAAFIAKVPDAPSSAIDGPETEASTEPSKARATPKDTSTPTPPRRSSPTTSESATPSSPPSASTSAAPDLDAIRRALREGDLDTVGDLLDEDPAGFDEKTPKWAARNRREAKLKAENASTLAKAEMVVSRWAPVATLAGAVQAGDYSKLPELVQMLTGADWDSAAMKAFRAVRNVDPSAQVQTNRNRELEAQLAAVQAERATLADRAAIEAIRDEVDEKDVVRKIPEWETRVAVVLKESMDPELGEPKLSVKQAAARVVRKEREAYERYSTMFDDAKPAKKPRPGPDGLARASGAAGTTKRKLTRDEWLASRRNG